MDIAPATYLNTMPRVRRFVYGSGRDARVLLYAMADLNIGSCEFCHLFSMKISRSGFLQ